MSIEDVRDITSFKWATVTATGPLRIKLDGDSAALLLTPDCLVDSALLAVSDRVRVELTQRKVVVHGKVGGGETGLFYTKALLDAGQLDNRYYTETEIDARTSKGTALSRQNILFGPGSSAAYANYGASLAYTKKLASAASSLRVSLSASGWANVSGNVIWLGVRIGATDYDVTQFYYNNVGVHHWMTGIRHITGLAAGALTVQPRYKAVAPAQFQSDGNDLLVLEVSEVLI